MGLFSKKVCSICGGDIGLFGNRKLEDGNMCKDCAAKLSPLFHERRSSTVEEIKAQLAYREANKAEVAAFHVTRSLGGNTKVLIDEDAKKFIVTSRTKWAEDNPDVIPFEAVTGCTYRINEKKTEIQPEETEEAKSDTTAAPAAAPVPMNAGMRQAAPTPSQQAVRGFAAQRAPQAPAQEGLKAHMAPAVAQGFQRPPAGIFGSSVAAAPAVVPASAPAVPEGPKYEYDYTFDMTINVNCPYFDTIEFRVNDEKIDSMDSVAFANAKNTCEEIKAVLVGIREDVRAAVVAAAAPKTAVTCPHCGASTIPDPSGRCEYCGGSVV